eukprot:jgi/Galph1/1968/GphlegSOOS_G640.1
MWKIRAVTAVSGRLFTPSNIKRGFQSTLLRSSEEENIANQVGSGGEEEKSHSLETRTAGRERAVSDRAFHTPVGSFDRNVVHPYCVRIFNVPRDIAEERLVKMMEECGELQQFSLSEETNSNGLLRCFATVGFTRIEAADRALSLDGKLFEGRTLRICRLRLNPPKSDFRGRP